MHDQELVFNENNSATIFLSVILIPHIIKKHFSFLMRQSFALFLAVLENTVLPMS